MKVWTATRVAELLNLRDEKRLSFTEIAKKMGVSRNAAIGKYQRVSRRLKGLPDYYNEPKPYKSTTTKHIRKKVTNLPRPEPPPEKNFALPESRMEAPVPVVQNSAPSIPTLDKRAMVKSLVKLYDKIDQLTSTECNFPIGQPSEPDYTYCFAPVTEYGRSYCDEHHELCYVKKVPRKRTNYVPGASHFRGRP